MDAHYYHVNINWGQGRLGVMCSPELVAGGAEDACIAVATPPEFPKGIPGVWSPEHLFTASVSSCFMTTFLSIAESSNLEFKSFSCTSSGKLDKVDGRLQMTEISLQPVLTIFKNEDQQKALRVLLKAESACLISNSIKSVIVLKPVVEVASAAAIDYAP